MPCKYMVLLLLLMFFSIVNSDNEYVRHSTFEEFYGLNETSLIDSLKVTYIVLEYEVNCGNSLGFYKSIVYTIDVDDDFLDVRKIGFRTFKGRGNEPLLMLAGEESGAGKKSLVFMLKLDSNSKSKLFNFRVGPEDDFSYAVSRTDSTVFLLPKKFSNYIKNKINEVLNIKDINACKN